MEWLRGTCSWKGGGFQVAYLRIKPAGISSLKLRRGCEGVVAFFQKAWMTCYPIIASHHKHMAFYGDLFCSRKLCILTDNGYPDSAPMT